MTAYALTNPYPGRKLGHPMAEIPVVSVAVDAISYAVAIIRQEWPALNYGIAHYNAPAGPEANGFTLFQIVCYGDGTRFILAVNPKTGDWWHAECELR